MTVLNLKQQMLNDAKKEREQKTNHFKEIFVAALVPIKRAMLLGKNKVEIAEPNDVLHCQLLIEKLEQEGFVTKIIKHNDENQNRVWRTIEVTW